MQREIKFRAWDTNEKIMRKDWTDIKVFRDSDVLIPMQYTGLKDKNGKDICEGDILSPSKREVKFGEYFGPFGMGTGFYTIAHSMKTELNKPDPFGMTTRQVDESEIIGDIYQNPELLK